MRGIGGRTVPKVLQFDKSVLTRAKPDVLILELGTNNLSSSRPEIVGSNLDDLVSFLLDSCGVHVIGVCGVIPRRGHDPAVADFNSKMALLNQYLEVVFESNPRVFTWFHRGFQNPTCNLYLHDGVHLNSTGQYRLYRSYRGAILQALRLLDSTFP